ASQRQLLQAHVPQASPMVIARHCVGSMLQPPPAPPPPPVVPLLAVVDDPVVLLEAVPPPALVPLPPAPVAPVPPVPEVSPPPQARGAAAARSRALKAVILKSPFIFIARSFGQELLLKPIRALQSETTPGRMG